MKHSHIIYYAIQGIYNEMYNILLQISIIIVPSGIVNMYNNMILSM